MPEKSEKLYVCPEDRYSKNKIIFFGALSEKCYATNNGIMRLIMFERGSLDHLLELRRNDSKIKLLFFKEEFGVVKPVHFH